jgi:hypothetical protein
LDDKHFDVLVRSLVSEFPRRRLFTSLVMTLPGILEPTLGLDAAGKKARRKHKHRRKQKTPGPTPAPSPPPASSPPLPPPSCTPNCGGRICGEDGCGGNCGVCDTNQVCQDGTCFCAPALTCDTGCCDLDEICAGGVCQGAGTCRGDDNICTGTVGCNGINQCDCLRRFADDALVCGNLKSCNACQNDTDCAGFGPGAFCARKVGTECCIGTPIDSGFCSVPCLA